MRQALDKEYLSRPAISDVQFKITDTEVYVGSEHTLYANITKLKRITKEEILQLYSEVIKMSKAKGVKISYKNHYKKKINENWEKYREELNYYNKMFDKTREKFLEVQKRGLHIGTTDDVVLDEACNYRNAFARCYWRTSTISLIMGIYRTLETYHRNLQYPDCNYYMLYL